MNHLFKLFLIAVAVVTAIPSFAVTQKEMEQARAVAAKHYLRYANNGSDYLDNLNPTSVAELSKSLKAKELENIKSFNAVAVPKDYASWDKAKLVDYWSNTFFKSPGLNADGKKCLSILAKNLGKIQVAPASAADKPAEKPADKPAETQPKANDAAAAAPASSAAASSAETDQLPAEVQAQAEVNEVQEAVEDERPKKDSGTGWYVAILVVLIGVVVWLVMYAQKSMKETGQVVADHRNSEKEIREAKRAAKEEVNKMRDQYAAAVSAKNDEIKQLREQCARLEEELELLRRRSENPAPVQERPQPAPAKPAPAKPSPAPAPAPAPAKPAPGRGPALPPVVFLGYVNQRGLFVKASRSLNAESSVYRMDIPDGAHGTFRVVADPSILDRLLSDPALWLEGGCDIENPDDADIATEIVTIAPGQALFADNTCRVVKKASIKFI